ncbi:MAG: outer membrane protein assembly factor BamE [Pseudomonadota bacterium]
MGSLERVTRRGIFALALAALAACSPIYRNHGYVPSDEDLAAIKVGISTKDMVAEEIGRPSSTGILADSGWYYVASRFRTVGARQPEEIAREVVAVSFDDRGVVENVERFGLERGRVVVLSRRVTDSNIKGLGFIGQLLGSIGRFNPVDMIR